MRKIRIVIFLIVTLFFLAGCSDKYQVIQSITVTPNINKPTGDTIILDSTKKFYFSRLRAKGTGGLIGTYKVTADHVNKQLYIVVSGRVRTNYAHSNSTITVAVNDDQKNTIVWRAMSLKYYFTEINKWCPFKDSIMLAPNTDGKYYNEISVLTFMGPSESENFDIDTLKIQVKEKL